MRTTPQRVNFARNTEDLRVAILGQLGFSTQYISAITGFTSCQVTYRLGRGAIKRKDYRNGESSIARHVASDAWVKDQVRRKLEGR